MASKGIKKPKRSRKNNDAAIQDTQEPGYQQAQQVGMNLIDPTLRADSRADDLPTTAEQAMAAVSRLNEAQKNGQQPQHQSQEQMEQASHLLLLSRAGLHQDSPPAQSATPPAVDDALNIRTSGQRPPSSRGRGQEKNSASSSSEGPNAQVQMAQFAKGVMAAANEPEAAEEAPTTKSRKRKLDTTPNESDAIESLKRLKESNGNAATVVRSGSTEAVDESKTPEAGPFTPYEMGRIHAFADQFRPLHNLGEGDLINLIQDQSRKQGQIMQDFWKGLQSELPLRSVTAIRKRCRRVFHNYEKRGKWTPEEDEKLRKAYEAKPDRWVGIGGVLGRMPEDCRDRWRNYLSCGTSRKSKEWTQQEELDLSNAVNDCISEKKETEKKKVREANKAWREDKAFEIDWVALINFNDVSKKLGHSRSRLQCYQHWNTMQRRGQKPDEKGEDGEDGDDQPAVPASIGHTPILKQDKARRWRHEEADRRYSKMLAGDKLCLLQQIRESGSFEEDKIPWPRLKREQPSQPWTTADRKDAFRRLKTILPVDERDGDLKQVVNSLITHLESGMAGDTSQFFAGDVDEGKQVQKKRKAPTTDDNEDDEQDSPDTKKQRVSVKNGEEVHDTNGDTGGLMDNSNGALAQAGMAMGILQSGTSAAPMAKMVSSEAIDTASEANALLNPFFDATSDPAPHTTQSAAPNEGPKPGTKPGKGGRPGKGKKAAPPPDSSTQPAAVAGGPFDEDEEKGDDVAVEF